MSLHKFADMVAKQGRGDDSLLIHMTPDEVNRLQEFAQANGRSLTINPDTGLPEAGMLSDLFKAVAPIALGAFLGPGAFGIAGMGLSAGTAGLITGGITSLATGSLSRGLMAGLGAYGGASMAQGVADLGAAEMAAPTIQAQMPEFTGNVADYTDKVNALRSEALAGASKTIPMANQMSAGISSITSSPEAMGSFAKDNWKSLAAAATPIMAGAMVPTTTKMPENTNPAYIRQKLYDPYTQTYKTLAPVKASEWGNRSFSDAYTNPQTGEMATLQPRQINPMATGGIVALANGGAVQHFDIGGEAKSALESAYAKNDVDAINKIVSENKITAEDVGKTWSGFDTSGIKGLQLYSEPAAPTYNQYTNEQIGQYLTTNPNADIAAAIKTTNADPAAVNAYLASLDNPFRGSTDTTGGSGTLGIYNQMKAQGIDPNELYAANKAFDPNYAGWSASDIAKGYNLDKGAYALSSQLGGNVSDKNWAKFMDDNGYSINDMAQAFGLSRNEVKARYDAAKKEEKKTTVTGTGGGGGDTTTPTRVTDIVLPTNPTVNAPPGTRNPYGNVNNPGDLTYNPDGTITVTPNIPGRPYGGFSGMSEVKNAYTAGGGSLGYTAPVPRTMADFESLYNKQTGDSMAAYNYLMGKGGAKYPIQSTAASGAEGIMRPYWSAGMKYKPKFLSYNEDGTIKSSTTSGNAPSSGAAGAANRAKSIYVLDNQGNSVEATLGSDGNYHTSSGDSYDVSGAPVVAKASGGIASLAGGGVTGNGNLNLNIPLNVGGQGGGVGGIGSTGGTSSVGSTGGNVNPNSGTGGMSTYPGSPVNIPNTRFVEPGFDSPYFAGVGAVPNTGGLIPDMGPAVDYSPFSEEGRRKMAELAARTKGNPATGPMPGGDYTSASSSSSPEMATLAQRLGIGMATGGMAGYAIGGGMGTLGGYSDGGRLLKGPGDGVSDSIPATIGAKQQPARLADGEFVIPARIVSELGNGSTEAGARKLYAMMDRVQKARSKTTGKNKVAANTRADKHLPA